MSRRMDGFYSPSNCFFPGQSLILSPFSFKANPADHLFLRIYCKIVLIQTRLLLEYSVLSFHLSCNINCRISLFAGLLGAVWTEGHPATTCAIYYSSICTWWNHCVYICLYASRHEPFRAVGGATQCAHYRHSHLCKCMTTKEHGTVNNTLLSVNKPGHAYL